MRMFHEYMDEYKKQMKRGLINQAYKGLMAYMYSVKTHFKNKYPEFYISSSLYFGYMDMTYFSIVTASLKTRKLKIAVVFVHQEFCFEVWLAGVNKKVQREVWQLIKDSGWNKYRLVPSTQGADAILEHAIVENPDFSDLDRLTKQIEEETTKFITAIDKFFSQYPN